MAYVVLARRWRPQEFEEVIGQRHVTQTLQNAISMDRVGHAFLFSGARGVGKTTVARILAKALNCKEGPTPQPCGRCDSCREISEGVSIDVQEIDGASNTGVDDVRDLREGLRYRPAKAPFRIYIIDEVHMLSNAAFNALLKTLEEPPPHVVFIFATTEAHKIPVTILSRCQRFDFKRIALTEIVTQLERISQAEGIEVDRETLTLLAREAQGSLRDAQSLLDQVISFSGERITKEEVQDVLGVLDRQYLFRTSEALIHKDAAACLEVVDRIFAGGYSLTYFYYQLVEHLRNLMVVRLAPESAELLHLPDHEMAQLEEHAREIAPEDLQLWFDLLVGAEEEIRRSANPRYLLEMLLMKMAHLDHTEDLEGLVNRIRLLREGLGPAQPQERTRAETRGATEVGPLEGGDRNPSELEWGAFLKVVRAQRPALASTLAQGRFLGCWEADKVRVAFPTAFHVERLSAEEQATALRTLCREFFGRPVQVLPVLDAQSPSCRGDHDRHQMQLEVMSHPLVQEALQVFGGRVVEIRPPERSSSSNKRRESRKGHKEVDGERSGRLETIQEDAGGDRPHSGGTVLPTD